MKQDLDYELGKGKQTSNGNTRTAGKEQYYTPEDTALKLLETFLAEVKVDSEALWVEPAGGSGSFVKNLIKKGVKEDFIYSVDVEPKHPLVKKGNFLTESKIPPGFSQVLCLTNPPFGRNNSLSIPFFKKLSKSCDYIGFIVSKSWRKFSVQNRLPLNAELIYDEELKINYVDEDGKPISKSKGNLNTVFQIWKIHKTPEGEPLKVRDKVIAEDRGYIKATSPSDADVCLTIFGYNSGKIKDSWDRTKKVSTDLYLKVSSKEVEEALKKLDYKRFSKNVASVEALSIQEIRLLLNQYFDRIATTD